MKITTETSQGSQVMTIRFELGDDASDMRLMGYYLKLGLAERLKGLDIKATVSTKFRKNRIIVTTKFKTTADQQKLESMELNESK